MHTRPLAVALLALLALALPAPAPAAPPTPPATAANPALSPLHNGLTTDGLILQMTAAEDAIYLAGNFSYLGEPVPGLAVLDAAGQIPAGAPRGPDAFASSADDGGSLIADGTGGWYAIGRLPGANSVSGSGVARLNADMRPLPGWPVVADAPLTDIVLHGDTLYVAGLFSEIAGQYRPGIAALDATTGALLPWSPPFNVDPREIAVSDGLVFVSNYRGGDIPPIAAFDRASGALQDWRPALIGNDIYEMVADNGQLFVAGFIGGDDGSGVATSQGLVVFDIATGASVGPRLSFSDTVVTVAVNATTIVVGGDFELAEGQPRAGLAAIDRASGALLPWHPELGFNLAADHNQRPAVFDVRFGGNTIYAAGLFERAGQHYRRNLAAFSASTGALLPWRGSANRTIMQVAPSGERVGISGMFTLAGGVASVDVAAIDRASGRPLDWEAHYNSGFDLMMQDFNSDFEASLSATPLGDVVYVQPDDRAPIALSRHSGATLAWGQPADSGKKLAASAGTVVVSHYVSNAEQRIVAYDEAGVERWQQTIPAGISDPMDLLIHGDVVYGIGTRFDAAAHLVFALGLADGAVRWQTPVSKPPYALAYHGDVLYVAGDTGGDPSGAALLLPLDPASGAQLPWPADLTPIGIIYDMTVSGDRLYLAGYFGAVGAAPRSSLAAIDLGPAPAMAAWAPDVPTSYGDAFSIAVGDSAVYVGALDEPQPDAQLGMLVYPIAAPAYSERAFLPQLQR